MGYDYTGGGTRQDPHWANAIRRIREGDTDAQRDVALRNKAIVAGIQTGIGTVGNVMKGMESRKLQENQANADTMRNAITDQTKLSGEQDAIRKSSDQYASPDYAGPKLSGESYGNVPSWLKNAQGDGDIADQASAASDNQNLNMQAAGASIGGYRSPDALNDQDQESDVRAADQNTGMNLIRSGGMMNTLARTR